LVGDEELVAMQRHVAECAACAGHDATIRRALLLFRNMAPIEPSAEFADRLQARLRAERRRQRDRALRAGYGGPGFGTFTALAAGAIAAGFVVISAFEGRPTPPALALSPLVVAAVQPVERPRMIVANNAPMLIGDSGRPREAALTAWRPLTDPAFAASVPNGMSPWPEAVLDGRPAPTTGSPQLKLTKLEQ